MVHRAGDLRTGDEDAGVLADHLAGVDAKARLSADLLAEGGWDLFVTVFGESHNVGHQLWHVHDETHPRHDPAVRARIGDPLTTVYEALDDGIATVLAAAPPDATVVLLLSHGMQAHHDGTHLVDALLHRLHRARQVGPEGARPAAAARRRVEEAAAAAVRRRVGRPAGTATARRGTVAGAGLAPGALGERVDSRALAPTLAALCGVEPRRGRPPAAPAGRRPHPRVDLRSRPEPT